MRSNSSAKAHMRCPSSSKSSTSSRGFVLCVPRRSSRVTLSRWMKRGAPSGGALDFGIRRWSQPCESRDPYANPGAKRFPRWPPFGFQTSHEHAIIPGAAPHSIAVEFIVWNPRGHLIHTYLVRCERTDASFHNFATHIGSATPREISMHCHRTPLGGRRPRVVDGGVTATGVLSRQRGAGQLDYHR